jgi:PAS domain-containing protein
MLVDAGPGLTIVDINGAFEALSMQSRAEAVGRPLFEVFPDNPAERTADGVSNLYASLKTASETGRPHAMAVQRYDIKNADGNWLERWWRAVNIPIFDAEMRLMYLLQQVERVERP